MSSFLTIYSTFKSQNLDSKSKLRLYKHNIMLKYMEIKVHVPKQTQKQKAKQKKFR